MPNFSLNLTILIFSTKFAQKGNFRSKTEKIALVVTYYIKLFRRGANRHNGILMFLLLLVVETKNKSRDVSESLNWALTQKEKGVCAIMMSKLY